MASLNNFSIPVRGIKSGLHQFKFHLDSSFFSEFEDSLIEEGKVDVLLDFDKRPDMFVLDVEVQGTVKAECDRCLADINLPIDGQFQLIIKLSDHESEVDEVVYLPAETTEINVAKYIYEFVGLSVPMMKTYDCQSDNLPPCDQAVLTRLEQEEKDQKETKNPIWDELNKLSGN